MIKSTPEKHANFQEGENVKELYVSDELLGELGIHTMIVAQQSREQSVLQNTHSHGSKTMEKACWFEQWSRRDGGDALM